MYLALLYAAVPSAGAEAPGHLAVMMCYTLLFASVCGTCCSWARYYNMPRAAILFCVCYALLLVYAETLFCSYALLRRAALLGTWLCNMLQRAEPTMLLPTRSHGILL